MSTIIKKGTGNTPATDPNTTSTVYTGTGTINESLKFVSNLSDYQVHHDDTDIREFDVRLASGEKIGEVEGLLADINSKLVRYAEIEVEDDVINRHTAGHYTSDDKHVLVPIGLVQINGDRTVTLHGIGLENMIDYPRYNRVNGYTTDYELVTNRYLGGFHEFSDDSYYDRTDLDDTFYSSKFYTGKWTK